MKRVLADTGPLYAMADQDDGWHDRIASYLNTVQAELIVPITVLPEVCYLIGMHLGATAEVKFMHAALRGEVRIEYLRKEDLARTAEVMDKYADAGLGFVDASIVALAERLKVREVLTTDRKHFSLVRPKHCPRFDLLP